MHTVPLEGSRHFGIPRVCIRIYLLRAITLFARSALLLVVLFWQQLNYWQEVAHYTRVHLPIQPSQGKLPAPLPAQLRIPPPPQPVTGPASRANSYARTMGPLHLGESFWRRRPAPASVGMPLTTTPVEDQLVAMLSTQDAYTPVRCARMRMRAIASAAATPLEFAFGAPSPGRSRPRSAGADGHGPSADASSDIPIPHEEWRGKICEWCYR